MSTKEIIAAYDQYYDVYDQEVVEFWNEFPRTTVQAFAAALAGRRVLDLGSGSGRDAVILRDEGLEVVCLDGSKSMVGTTRQLGFESHQAEFGSMNFPGQSFDGVWAYTSLIHVPPTQAAESIAAVARMLKPGGAFLIGVILGDTAGMVERKTMPGAQRYFKKYSQPELTRLVSALGFELQYEEEYRPHNTGYLSQIYVLRH